MRVYNASRLVVDTVIQKMLPAVDSGTSHYTVMDLLSASKESYSFKVEDDDKFGPIASNVVFRITFR